MFAGALADAVRSHPDLHFGLYFSLFEWFNPLYLQDKANNFTTQTYVKVCIMQYVCTRPEPEQREASFRKLAAVFISRFAQDWASVAMVPKF